MRPGRRSRFLPVEMQTEIIELSQLAATKRAHFGEFLVQQAVLDRFQLFRALQLQDRLPGARLGTCAVALGYVAHELIEQLYLQFLDRDAELETMTTDAFCREPEIVVIYNAG